MAFDNTSSAINTLRPFLNAPSFVNGTYDTTNDIIQWTKGYLISTEYQAAGTLDWRIRTADIDLNNNGNTNDDVTVNLFNSPDGAGTSLTTTVNEVNEWKLGDIISSTPKIQSRFPLHNYDTTYSDDTYKQFTTDACIVNSAALCPLLTAIPARFSMMTTGGYTKPRHGLCRGQRRHAPRLQARQAPAGRGRPAIGLRQHAGCTRGSEAHRAGLGDVTGNLATSYYPGKELWAYIPLNSLPYLRLMAEPAYCHNTNVDLAPYIFDASINRPSGCTVTNTPDCTRSNTSWRTVLIGGFRLGGACRDNGATCATGGCVTAPTYSDR